MARPTILDLTQRILSDMDSDEVNSISDTLEATQVAEVIRGTYHDIVNEFDLESEHTLFSLTASGTTARPTHMTIPESYHSVEWIKYDCRSSAAATQRNFVLIPFMEPGEFSDRIMQRDSDATEVDIITDTTGVELLIRNDANPNVWTTFNGQTIIFDSYDSTIDTTLQSSKSQAYGQLSQDLTITDTTTIDLPHVLYNLLENEARETCFDIYKDGATPKVAARARRARVRAKRVRKITRIGRENFDLPDYGRN